MKSLHCCSDEKFIKGMISLFESDPTVENDYVIVSDNEKLRFVDSSIVKVISPNKLSKYCLNYDVVFFHYLKAHYYNIIPYIPKQIKVVWFGWGADMYDGNTAIIKGNYLGQMTDKYINEGSFDSVKKICRNIIFFLRQKPNRDRALKRIDYFSGVFPYEYDLLKDSFPDFNAKPVDFYYGSNNFFVPEEPKDSYVEDRHNIIVGNSAAYTNNHLDALVLLKNSGWNSNKGKIIVPLSYGGDKRYIKEVISFGKKLFGDLFVPLENYVPLNQYLSIISSCKTAIFYHKRQQASDNVFMQMMYGARVYMSKDNLMYTYLKSQGYKVYSLEEEGDLINKKMSKEDVMANRMLLSQNYSSSKLIERVKIINTTLIKEIFE